MKNDNDPTQISDQYFTICMDCTIIKISSIENEKCYDNTNTKSQEKDLIKINQNIKDIETISHEVTFNFNEEVEEKETLDSIEIFDFEKINDLDSSQIEFDFNESLDSLKETELKKSNSEYDSDINSFEANNQNLENSPEMENLDSNPEMQNPDKDDLNIKIKNLENVEISNVEKIEIDVKDNTPFDNSIEETIKNSNDSSKEELKKFNYSFQNNIKRINEMDNQPAYKRLGYNIDQNVKDEKNSPLTLDKDKNDEVQLRSNNSFLHDNVD